MRDTSPPISAIKKTIRKITPPYSSKNARIMLCLLFCVCRKTGSDDHHIEERQDEQHHVHHHLYRDDRHGDGHQHTGQGCRVLVLEPFRRVQHCLVPDDQAVHLVHDLVLADGVQGIQHLHGRLHVRKVKLLEEVGVSILGASYGEAADLLWEISGRPDWYYAKRTKKKEFTLTEEEKTLIGLHLPTRILVPKSLKDYKETLRKDRRYDPAFVDGYLQLETQYVHTADFADRGAFRRIVFNRTTDTLSELRYKRKHEPDNAIREIYTQAESTCEDILARLREAQRKTKRGRA